MAQPAVAIENNFTKGLVTEFTGLNFPENAATDCDNCEFTIVGDVLRRQGIDLEANGSNFVLNRSGKAISDYKWNNAGGDGLTQLIVEQVGGALYFYRSSTAAVASPLSTQILVSTVDLTAFTATGGGFTNSFECQYASGNGYLFVYHPSCDPIYCTYNTGVITGNRIVINIRDFTGVLEPGVSYNTRPSILTGEHSYNLLNQGWVSGNQWAASSTSTITLGLGNKSFIVASGIVGVTGGQPVTIVYTGPTAITGIPDQNILSGTVVSYAGTTMVINVNSGATGYFGRAGADWNIIPRNTSYLTAWNTAAGNYPSNSDVWWYFKNAAGDFDPATTISNTSSASSNAPRGHFILNAFSQQRDVSSGLPGLTTVTTTARPKTGTWFQGRVWYAGADAQQPAAGDADYYTWTENIYFSQIIKTPSDFGNCYQVNDPTSEELFDLLPTDGGVIQIQGCGSIYKLFPIQNGLLVFASNGIWFITGSQGIGFSANDFTPNHVSSVRSISGSSFVNVQGYPYFWNEEGIYTVQPTKNGVGLEVEPITVGTILSFYNNIPVSNKKHVRGDYHSIDYVIKWAYKQEEAVDVTNTYNFDRILNYNVYNKAFYPYTISNNLTFKPYIHGVIYVESPGGSTAPSATFKYPCSFEISGSNKISFAEEFDVSYTDWRNFFGVGSDYNSYFITGYKLKGGGIRKFQPDYIYVFSRADEPTSYKIQGIWDYANSGNSGRYSSIQLITNSDANYGMIYKRHRIRGQGLVLQFKFTSVQGQPFDIMGWTSWDTQNSSI